MTLNYARTETDIGLRRIETSTTVVLACDLWIHPECSWIDLNVLGIEPMGNQVKTQPKCIELTHNTIHSKRVNSGGGTSCSVYYRGYIHREIRKY